MSESPEFYWVGGSLPLTVRSYVQRRADAEFYAGLKAGKFCYVLNARQMGKSSLRVRTMDRLQRDGVVCVAIDITAIGSAEVTAEQWYLGLVWEIVKQVKAQTEALGDWRLPTVRSWWNEREGLPLVQRWGEFLEGVLLVEVTQPIVVFVDEIDSVLGLPFRADDFFAAIRECYNRRVDVPSYERLTFALLGVCAPQDLIQDRQRTPFNIGESIELAGFTAEEAIGLAEGLPGGAETLREIIVWTGGQPFLTQRACRLLFESDNNLIHNPKSTIQNLIQSEIINVWESNDDQVHFQTIQNSVMANESISGAILGLYQRVLLEDGVASDGSREQVALRLTGLVVKRDDRLQIANRIYQQVFNFTWVTEKLVELRFYSEKLQNWQQTGDKSFLLRGEELRLAKVWSGEKERRLSPEDYHFLQASQDLERSFKFMNDSASNLYELAELCDKYPQEAMKYGKTGSLGRWLSGTLGQPNLEALMYEENMTYKTDAGKALEVFTRLLFKNLSRDGDPLVVIRSENQDIGRIPIGCKKVVEIYVDVTTRGFIWGKITYESETDGVSINGNSEGGRDNYFDSRKSKKITINIDLPSDPEIVKNGKYFIRGKLHCERMSNNNELETTYDFEIAYEAIKATIIINPKFVDLGVLKSNTKDVSGKIKIDTEEGENLTISGRTYTSSPYVVSVSPRDFQRASYIKYRVTPGKSSRFIEEKIGISVNGQTFFVPVYFVSGIDYLHVLIVNSPLAALCFFFVRFISTNLLLACISFVLVHLFGFINELSKFRFAIETWRKIRQQ
jgi:hypothetical protein